MSARRTLAAASLTLQFMLELAALAAFAYWGYSAAGGAVRFALATAAPLSAAAAWAFFGSPRAPHRLTGAARLLFELAFFGAAAVALGAAGRPALGVAFGLVALANIGLLNALGHG